ncbi:hypothetical protein VFPPC_18756 [Pochonia chlamydosporia 170]|uniref:Uncharacterized protein n=1 Tax=Pochonia chlamydosporia 170 TaxID=1380566 RepID=A0A219ARY5_METCM|nr:hypothetical protein VFPPC_18756 [Pochonia chlamydosporia 170]OWT43517.1 hypothetical protein VFPPC_18756 [Pochonia chlamydosporia 170]
MPPPAEPIISRKLLTSVIATLGHNKPTGNMTTTIHSVVMHPKSESLGFILCLPSNASFFQSCGHSPRKHASLTSPTVATAVDPGC